MEENNMMSTKDVLKDFDEWKKTSKIVENSIISAYGDPMNWNNKYTPSKVQVRMGEALRLVQTVKLYSEKVPKKDYDNHIDRAYTYFWVCMDAQKHFLDINKAKKMLGIDRLKDLYLKIKMDAKSEEK